MSENLSLKQNIFRNLSAELGPEPILATNTSSISITKIAAATIPDGETASSEKGKQSASRVVGTSDWVPWNDRHIKRFVLQACTTSTLSQSWFVRSLRNTLHL